MYSVVLQWLFGLGLALVIVHNPSSTILGNRLNPSFGLVLVMCALVGELCRVYVIQIKRSKPKSNPPNAVYPNSVSSKSS